MPCKKETRYAFCVRLPEQKGKRIPVSQGSIEAVIEQNFNSLSESRQVQISSALVRENDPRSKSSYQEHLEKQIEQLTTCAPEPS